MTNTEAIEILQANRPDACYEQLREAVDKAIKALEEPQRKKGKWIDCDGGIATCSVCGDRWGVYGVMNFCPNCGADMREPEDIPMEYFESGGR